jgi:hypothetical protein
VFRAEIKDQLSKIFGFKKVTFDAPGESYEQDTLFVEINESPTVAKEGRCTARVTGSLVVYSQLDKLPFGYFNKRIQQADPELTKKFFFFDIDLNPMNSPARIQNIAERRVRFVYLYSAQYDPEHGEITTLEGIL